MFYVAAATGRAPLDLRKSVESEVPADKLTDLPTDARKKVEHLSRIRCWGANPGPSNRANWERMAEGDIGIFYTKGKRFRYAGRVVAKARSPKTV